MDGDIEMNEEARIIKQAQAAARVIIAFRMELGKGAFDCPTQNRITEEFAKALILHHFCGHQFESVKTRLIAGDLPRCASS